MHWENTSTFLGLVCQNSAKRVPQGFRRCPARGLSHQGNRSRGQGSWFSRLGGVPGAAGVR